MSDAAITNPAQVPLAGLILDWGGVLTASLDGAMGAWAQRDRVDFAAFRDVMRQWVGRHPDDDGGSPRIGADIAGNQAATAAAPPSDSDTPVADLEQAPDAGPAGNSPVHRLERGEISAADFEKELARELAVRGYEVPPAGLLARLLSGLAELDDDMLGLVRRARAAGLRTALLSNSWGNEYPEQLWQGLFDTVVISGAVGMRKPEARIFRHTAEQLGLPPQACVMVDDLPHNVSGAAAVGMVAVRHRTYAETVAELEALFGVTLR